MKVSRSETKYVCINGGNDDKTVKMEDTKVPREKEFKYLGSTVQESGDCEREVKKRLQAGWNGWRRVSGVICYKKLPARVKGKVYSLVQWFSTFSVPWPIFQPKLTSQPTLVNKIKFPSQNHSVLQKKKKGLHLELLSIFPIFVQKS